jgi:hypothetical protein
MQSPDLQTLRTAYRRYGPGTDRDDLAAGYAAATGAVLVAALYAASVWAIDAEVVDLGWTPYFATIEYNWAVYAATTGLLFAVPAAFLVGVAGWRIAPARSAFRGAVVGAVGAVAAYLVAFVPLAAGAVAAGGVANPFELAAVAVAAALVLTWWLAVPVGGLVGVVYAARRPKAA